jgi:hypothetical protein
MLLKHILFLSMLDRLIKLRQIDLSGL